MNQIGFKNFRKFTDFPTIDLGDITILVGGNNAGKSTLVKAMLLMRDFLKSRIVGADKTNNVFQTFSPEFSFDTEHVNVGDFYRAFCRQSPSKEDTIIFTMKIDQFRFVVNIRGERKPDVLPKVSLIAVYDEDKDVSFTFDFSKNQMTARFNYDRKALNSDISDENEYLLNKKSELTVRLDKLKEKLSGCKDLEMITSIKVDIERTTRELGRIESELKDMERYISGYSIEEYDSATIDMSFFMGDNIGELMIPELIKGFIHYAETGTYGDKRSKEYKEQEGKKSFLRGKSQKIYELAEELKTVLNKQAIEYIYAHSVSQDSIYAKCANSSDYTKRTIHEFFNARISKGDAEFSLIEDWLEEFQIGTSLKVIPYKGDNYSLVIFDKENPEITSNKRKGYPGGIDLADKGMGSIQIVILLLRLATLIRKYKGQQLTILLEEPEQNLHPALQSKLADFVNDVKSNFNVNFIIETHSEYLVRHIQVLKARLHSNGINNAPFKVFYMTGDIERPINDMGFQKNGKFEKEFGPGFFNVADDAAMELFDLDIED